eukprot:scaffold27982_cov31-Tisochrysis_lutea.AAC.1
MTEKLGNCSSAVRRGDAPIASAWLATTRLFIEGRDSNRGMLAHRVSHCNPSGDTWPQLAGEAKAAPLVRAEARGFAPKDGSEPTATSESNCVVLLIALAEASGFARKLGRIGREGLQRLAHLRAVRYAQTEPVARKGVHAL